MHSSISDFILSNHTSLMKKSLVQLANEFDLAELSRPELTALLTALSLRFEESDDNRTLISLIRNAKPSAKINNAGDGAVVVGDGETRLRQSEMRQSTLLQAVHLQKCAQEAEKRAQQLENEARQKAIELELEEEEEEREEAAKATAAGAAMTAADPSTDDVSKPSRWLGSMKQKFKGWKKRDDGRLSKDQFPDQPFIPDHVNPLSLSNARASADVSSRGAVDGRRQMANVTDIGEEGEGPVDESTPSLVSFRMKQESSSSSKQWNRLTVISQEFVVTEDDLAAEIKEAELEELEEVFDQANIDEESSDQLEEASDDAFVLQATVTECNPGELSPATDSFLIRMQCGKWEWQCSRFWTDFIELKAALFQTIGTEEYGISLPKQREEGMFSGEAARLKTITVWLNALLAGVNMTTLLSVEIIDDFFELFWNLESARKAGPIEVDVMQYLALSRVDSEASLKASNKEGTFLIRKRTSGDLVLSVFLDPGFWHGIVSVTIPKTIPEGMEPPKFFMKGTRKQHDSLDALLLFHRINPFSNNGGPRTLKVFLGEQKSLLK